MKRFVRALAKRLGNEDSQKTLGSWQEKIDESLLSQKDAFEKAQKIIFEAHEKGLSNAEISAITGLGKSTIGRIIKEGKAPVCLSNENAPA
jgi:Fic family protein